MASHPDADIEMTDDAGRYATQHYAPVEDEDIKYPNRPHNHSETFPFHELYQSLFEPLIAVTKKKVGIGGGWSGTRNVKPHEARRQIIDRFIARWRTEVGGDIYPAFRLIMPDKDRDRTVYGLKEKSIGKIFVKVMRIDKNSEGGNAMINWKMPGQRSAGDFAGRCYEIIKKSSLRDKPGNMTITEVNEKLDELAGTTKEEQQIPILRYFYENMDPDEMLWLIRIILKQMKVGATEKTFFDAWHPDAENLFNISSSLKRVCWELYDPNFRLDSDDKGVTLMSCLQPQLANFQKRGLDAVVKCMQEDLMGTEGETEATFWIEEKLDGERMQMHMDRGEFRFWSRKAKEYTYLYGSGFESGSLTRYLEEAFHENVKSIILDGEMITWDPVQNAMVGFGTLKGAALAQEKIPEDTKCHRPLFKVFDILYLNGKSLTNYSLADRRKALDRVVQSVEGRLEIHEYTEAKDASAIDRELRKVVDTGSEGLVVKNPRSIYRLNDRNNDWIKVKPEYMTEFGEEFDLLVIGAYWGSGRRGGILSSFLCGLRVDQHYSKDGDREDKFWSFCKVGGGFTADDYSKIQHNTDGKWHDWDPRNPPLEYMELAGAGFQQFERPDRWIKPSDSFVVSVKAAQVTVSNQFRFGKTLRFPRFKAFKNDKTWREALTITEFVDLKEEIDRKITDKKMEVEKRSRHVSKRVKREFVVLGTKEETAAVAYVGPRTDLFQGMSFFIATEALKPEKKSEAELVELVKAHGGRIYKNENAVDDIKIIADRNTIKVAALKAKRQFDIIRPSWVLDCIRVDEEDRKRGKRGGYILPLEPDYMLFSLPETAKQIQDAEDKYGDSYARPLTVDGLLKLFEEIKDDEINLSDAENTRDQLLLHHPDTFHDLPGWLFHSSLIYLDLLSISSKNKLDPSTPLSSSRPPNEWSLQMSQELIKFGCGKTTENFHDLEITHIVVGPDRRRIASMRSALKWRSRIPRIVGTEWVEECVRAGTVVDEERFVVS